MIDIILEYISSHHTFQHFMRITADIRKGHVRCLSSIVWHVLLMPHCGCWNYSINICNFCELHTELKWFKLKQNLYLFTQYIPIQTLTKTIIGRSHSCATSPKVTTVLDQDCHSGKETISMVLIKYSYLW